MLCHRDVSIVFYSNLRKKGTGTDMDSRKSKSGDNTPDDNKKVIKNLSLNDLRKIHSFNRPDSSLQRTQSFSESHSMGPSSDLDIGDIKNRLPLQHMKYGYKLEIDHLDYIQTKIDKKHTTGDITDQKKQEYKESIDQRKKSIESKINEINNHPVYKEHQDNIDKKNIYD